MKLRNKKTGEIRPAEAMEDGIYLYDKTTKRWYKYALYLLAKYWQYYEEPKVAYFIDAQGDVCEFQDTDVDDWTKEEQIGNKFETKEEAEKAIEKLKAYKRLRDKGFRFKYLENNSIVFDAGEGIDDQHINDMNLLFGEEEE